MARLQSQIASFGGRGGGGVVYKQAYEYGTASPSVPGSCPESFQEVDKRLPNERPPLVDEI
jgi:hypothetical protein